jgi:DNA end-binding protein Ku
VVENNFEYIAESVNPDKIESSNRTILGKGTIMRSIWAGAISFGMVVIPVKLYAATEQRDVSFRQVHRQDGGRIQFRRVCSLDGQEVPYADVAKGYELSTGDMVVLTDDDFKELPLASAKRIDVLHFAPAGQLDPILANKSYYLEPEPAGVRAYVLFRDALERSDRVAVCKVAIRQREALAALRIRDGVLVLETLLWPDEIRAPDFAFLEEDIDVRAQELKMAASLIDTMTEDFDPSAYKDAYREALESLVQAKIEGNEVVRPAGSGAEAEQASGPADLTETLRASVAAAKANRGKSGAGPKRQSSSSRSSSRSSGSKSGAAKADGAKSGASKSGTAKSSKTSAKPKSSSTSSSSSSRKASA